MMQMAELVHIHPDIEEEVVLRIAGLELACFASVCPYAIEVGSSYPVELSLYIDGDCEAASSHAESQSVVRVGSGFEHVVTGVLKDGQLEACGWIFDAEDIREESAWLDGSLVSLRVQRIDVWFE